MRNISRTSHAQKRGQQRGIPIEHDEIRCKFGKWKKAGKGMVSYTLPRRLADEAGEITVDVDLSTGRVIPDLKNGKFVSEDAIRLVSEYGETRHCLNNHEIKRFPKDELDRICNGYTIGNPETGEIKTTAHIYKPKKRTRRLKQYQDEGSQIRRLKSQINRIDYSIVDDT